MTKGHGQDCGQNIIFSDLSVYNAFHRHFVQATIISVSFVPCILLVTLRLVFKFQLITGKCIPKAL